MSRMKEKRLVTERQRYYNMISKKYFKLILEDIVNDESENDKALMEKSLIGAMAMIELDCIADMKNEALSKEKTKKHYLEYTKLAQRSKLAIRDDVKRFIDRIKQYCL